MSKALLPQNPEEKDWAAAIHAAALVGLLLPLGLVLGPLVVWLLKKNDSPYLNQQGKKAINFQLTMLLAFFVFLLLGLVIKPLMPIAFMTGIAGLIFAIMAAYNTYNNGDFNYPFSLNILK